MATTTAPGAFPESLNGLRSGLASRYYIGTTISDRTRFLGGSFKHGHVWTLANDATNGIKVADAPSTDPVAVTVRVPPWTKYAAWMIQTVGDGDVYAQRNGSARQMRLTVADPPGSSVFANAHWSQACEVAASGSDEPVAIDVDNDTGDWVDRVLDVWIGAGDSVELYALAIAFVRYDNVTDLITVT